MTLTEEQRPTAGFDLEKARDVEKAMSPMPWIVLEEAHGEMIIIRNPNHPMYIDGIVAWGRVAEANTPDAIGIAYMRENFSNLIGEIERLRASLVEHEEHENQTHEVLGNILGTDDTLENVAKRAAARIKELEGMLSIRTEELDIAHSVARSEKEMHEKELAAFARRIKELEDALVEGLTNFLHYRASCYDPARRCPYAKECDDCSTWDACGHVEKFRSEARQLLQAEGKIGPGGMHENHQSF